MNGLVTAPDPEALGAAIARLAGDRALAPHAWGEAGYDRARRITWSDAIDRLVAGLEA